MKEKICIVGMGYVGLTLAAAMSERGFCVVGVEIDIDKLKMIHKGKSHFLEVGLDVSLGKGLRNGTLKFCAEIPTDEVFNSYIVTVGTPLDDHGNPRMDMIENVCYGIAGSMHNGSLIILRSTVIIGTSRKIVKPILDECGKDYFLSFCPERTIEGKAMEELHYLPQIIGGLNNESVEKAEKIFSQMTPTIHKVSTLESAELIKLLDNSFRDLFFSFGNEVALICESLGLRSKEVIHAANSGYPRTNIAKPGFVGGPCLEKDPHILVHSLAPNNFIPKLIQTGRLLNESIVPHVFNFVADKLKKNAHPTIALLGLAFKGSPDTDDLRGSPAIDLIRLFKKDFPEATLRGHDYFVKDEDIITLGLQPVNDVNSFVNADMVILLNNNKKYSWIDYYSCSLTMNDNGAIYDCWGMISDNSELAEGVQLYVLGG